MNLEAESTKLGIPLCFLLPILVIVWAIVVAASYGLLAIIVTSLHAWLKDLREEREERKDKK